MLALAAAVLSLGAWWQWGRPLPPSAQGQAGVAPATPAWSLMAAGKHAPAVEASPGQGLTADQVRERLFVRGSFQGTEAAGEWCVTNARALQPCHGLRSRFEYYLLGLGEVSVGDIRVLIGDEARRAHGEPLAGQILALFDQYWQLRTHQPTHQFVPSDRSTWVPVFEEQRRLRRQFLGAAWAEAFFRDDEQQFQDHLARLESGQPPPPDVGEPVPQMVLGGDPAALRAERVARYGEAAADRLAQVDAQWADWERRLNAARAEWSRLQATNHLSDVQKTEEMHRYVAANFQGKETVRVRALVRY